MSGNILIVDDDEANRKFLSTLLRENGWKVETAVDGAEGLHAAKHIKPDLIIMDLMMPHMSGFSLFRIVRESDDLKHVPVIIISAFRGEYGLDLTEKGRIESLTGRSPDAFLDKPLEPDSLLEIVKKLIEK